MVVDEAINQMQFTGLRLLRHRDVLIERNYGADVVSDCRDEDVKTSVDQTAELAENCAEIIGLLTGVAE